MMNYGFNTLFNTQPQGFTTLPVSNIQEANSFRVSMDGTPTYFHNMATGEIYVKRNNRQTGLCDFETYIKGIYLTEEAINESEVEKTEQDLFICKVNISKDETVKELNFKVALLQDTKFSILDIY